MGLADAQALLVTAKSEIAAASWSAAINTLMQLQAELAVLPDTAKGSMSMSFRGRELESLIAMCQRRLAGATGIESTKLKRISVSD